MTETELNNALEEPAETSTAAAVPVLRDEYEVVDGSICLIREDKEGNACYSQLCNFRAAIVAEEIIKEGDYENRMYLIAGKLDDDSDLPLVEVPAEKYDSLEWLSAWGPRAIYNAGKSIKDHIRVAVERFSENIKTQYIFRHTGWTKFDNGEYFFLHSGGAIGADGLIPEVIVDLSAARMNNYCLPPPPERDELKNIIRVSLGMADLAPDRVSIPLLAGTYLAPLSEFLALDLSLYLAGMSGSQKSELSAMSQAHYGAGFDRLSLPANWEGTANSLEKLAYLAKDVIWTVDDFVPKGTTSDVRRLHKEADRVFRGKGNQSGRSRMNADGSLRETYYPRGLVLSNGEDVPDGNSLGARMVLLEVKRGDVDLQKLTELQAEAKKGSLASAMSGYIRWLAPKAQLLKDTLQKRHQTIRDNLREEGIKGHDRTPDNIANLYLGLETLIDYAKEYNALSEEDATKFLERSRQALTEVAKAQANNQEETNPADRFLGLLSSAITGGLAHLAGRKGDHPSSYLDCGWREQVDINSKHAVPFPKGMLIGWFDEADNTVLLDADLAFAVAQTNKGPR